MKKLKLEKLLLGSLTEAQQKNVIGGYGVPSEELASALKVNTVCVTPPPPLTTVETPCTPNPVPPTKTTNTTPCA